MIQDQSQSSFGLAPNVAAGLASLFTWAGGLVILLGKPPQQWVRFVAVQAIVMSVTCMVAFIAITILSTILGVMHLGILSLVLWLIQLAIGFAYFIAWIICTVRAFQGAAQRIPFVGDMADRWVPKSAAL
jgi:uncharacterized membrane protein